jgi:hypothetical protein
MRAASHGVTIGLLLFVSIFAGYWWSISGPAYASCSHGRVAAYGGCSNIIAWHGPCGVIALAALLIACVLIARVAP